MREAPVVETSEDRIRFACRGWREVIEISVIAWDPYLEVS